MSRTVGASCVAGVVSSGSAPVIEADILSAGVRSSEGLLILDKDKATYLTSNAEDLQDVIEKINGMMTTITTILTAHDAFHGGASAANIASVIADNVQLLLMKENLK